MPCARTGLNRKAHKLHAQHKELLKEAAAAKLSAANLKQLEAAATRKLVELEAQVESLQVGAASLVLHSADAISSRSYLQRPLTTLSGTEYMGC